MINYNHAICKICNTPFQETDDIVVCPDCGTPYHRDCWKQEGHCVNTALHESGGSWQKEQNAEEERALAERCKDEPRTQICPSCQRANAKSATHCDCCGKPLSQPQEGPTIQAGPGFVIQPEAPFLGMDPDEEFDGTTLAELSSYVGQNTLYYLPMFKAMKQSKRRITFNLTSFLFPSFYFANRKMWLYGLLCVLVQTLLAIPSRLMTLSEIENFEYLATSLSMDQPFFRALLAASNLLNVIFSVSVCLFANYLYYRRAVRQITKMKQGNLSPLQLKAVLEQTGGVSVGNLVLMGVIWFALFFTGASLLFLFF